MKEQAQQWRLLLDAQFPIFKEMRRGYKPLQNKARYQLSL